ncbi:MAG: hypothetical protein D6760_04730 [Deltaproteobacteria bacterium]|nr:MAG: hypothetical protein D6760_04730 [Deltaproteobacteria bacterium]
MNQLLDRMLRAAKLDVALYEEVEADESALAQAATVVVLSSVAAGIGLGVGHAGGLGGILIAAIGSLVGWALWAGLTYLIGAKLLPEPQTNADFGQLLRTIGFSSAPGVIRLLGIIPGLAAILSLVAAVWMLAAMVVAVRQALDYQSTGRAVGVCLIGFIVQVLLLAPFM